jgi:hypothetical protein
MNKEQSEYLGPHIVSNIFWHSVMELRCNGTDRPLCGDTKQLRLHWNGRSAKAELP